MKNIVLAKKGMACWMADRAVETIRERFGWQAVGYGSVALEISRPVPDEFRELTEKALVTGLVPWRGAASLASREDHSSAI